MYISERNGAEFCITAAVQLSVGSSFGVVFAVWGQEGVLQTKQNSEAHFQSKRHTSEVNGIKGGIDMHSSQWPDCHGTGGRCLSDHRYIIGVMNMCRTAIKNRRCGCRDSDIVMFVDSPSATTACIQEVLLWLQGEHQCAFRINMCQLVL